VGGGGSKDFVHLVEACIKRNLEKDLSVFMQWEQQPY